MDKMLFVYGALHQLQEWNLVQLGGLNDAIGVITLQGIGHFDQLEASGYRPSTEEITELMQNFNLQLAEPMDGMVLEAIVKFISNWDDLKVFINKQEQ